jgi:peptidoglycan hydrolase-like protein with peptidoglycan-binding domain
MEYSLTWLPDVLHSAGLKVAEVPGWRSRGNGDVGRIRGVICHHTGGANASHGVMPSLATLVNGRAGDAQTPPLSGPLAQLGLARDGTFYVIAAGKANHAGRGNWRDCTTGNTSFIGIEAENTGRPDDPWPEVQLDAYRRGVAAILNKIGADPDACCGHKEYALPAGRKDDPRAVDMEGFRAEVAAIMSGGGQTRPLIAALDGSGRLTIRRGAHGALVDLIQDALGLPVDHAFGPITEAKVRQFQREKGLVPDGIVGPATWKAVDALA